MQTRYSKRSIAQVLKKATKKAKIYKAVTLHCFYHSYARHLHETGTDLRFNQKPLGHKSNKTPEIYPHANQSLKKLGGLW